MKEYFFDKLKNIVTSCISVRYSGSEGYILEPKFGRLNLSILEDVSSVDLYFKRLSGNGKIYINDELYVVISKNNEFKNIKLTNSSLNISRPNDSIGEVAVSGIKLNLNIGDEMYYNWKSIINKLSSYKGLSLIKNKSLVASVNAFIEPAEMVENIQTEPPNVFSIINNKILFNHSCNILSIKLKENHASYNEEKLFLHRENAYPIINNINYKKTEAVQSKSNIINNINLIKNNNLNSNIIYDSDKLKGFNKVNISTTSLLKSAKIIIGGGKNHLVLKSGGNFSIPISSLEKDKQYIVVINAKKNSGNGRLKLSLSNNNESSTLYFNSIFENKQFIVNAKTNENIESLKLNIWMDSDCSGEIIISRAMILNNINNLNLNNSLSCNNNFIESFSKIDNLSIRDLAKDVAMIHVINKEKIFNVSCVLKTLCYSARQYVANISSYIDGIEIIDKDKLIKNINYSLNCPTLTLGKLNRLEISNRLYIEEWDNKIFPSNNDLNIIEQSNSILTTSNFNYVYLKSLFPKKNIKIISKPRIHLKNKNNIKSNYYIYFEKNIFITKKIIDSWDKNFPKLYIIGTNLNTPSFIEKISEYEEYENIYALLSGAEGLIDFNLNNQYNSSWLRLAEELGCKIITNNIQNINDQNSYLNLNLNLDNINIDSNILLEKIYSAKYNKIKTENSKIEFENFLVGNND